MDAPRPAYRTPLALLLAAATIAVAMPAQLVPHLAPLRAALLTWWPAWTALLCLLLALAGRLLDVPTEPLRPARTRRDHDGLAVGLLLMLEPVLHLALLGVSALAATRFGAEALLPAGWARPGPNASFLAKVAVFAVLVPICEEYFFRGRLLPWLRARLGTFSAVSISAGAFAVAHGDLAQAAVAFPVGLLLGTMRAAGADLGACMLAHAVHNGLFLIGGAGLVALPWIGPAMAGAGALLTAFTWVYHLRPRPAPHARFALLMLLAGLAVGLTLPTYRALADRWWVAGTQRLCHAWRIPDEDLCARLLAQERGGQVWSTRRDALVARLRAIPCQTARRQATVLALLDPAPGDPAAEDDIFDQLAALATAARPGPANAEIARRLGAGWPAAFVAAAGEYPEALPRWLPLPTKAAAAATLLAATVDGHDRKVLLGALERSQPGRVADVLFALTPAQVTALDVRHLRLHYPDAAARLAVLARRDPARAAAFAP